MLQNLYYEAPTAKDYAEAITRGNEQAQKASEARAVVASVLAKFDGKKCGEKTREKIRDAGRSVSWAVGICGDGRIIANKLNEKGLLCGCGFTFWGEMLNDDNTINAGALAEAYISANYNGPKIGAAVENVAEIAERLSSAAADVFDALQKASAAIRAYNDIAKATPNVKSISDYNVALNCPRIEII